MPDPHRSCLLPTWPQTDHLTKVTSSMEAGSKPLYPSILIDVVPPFVPSIVNITRGSTGYAHIARDLLAIPASSVDSESAFSIYERIISDFRSSLTPETVEALICTQDWNRVEGSSEFSMASINDLIMGEMAESNTRL